MTPPMTSTSLERALRHVMIATGLGGLVAGVLAWAAGLPAVAHWSWTAGTIPVAISLLVSMVRDVLAGRVGIDAIALLSMVAALALGEPLAGIVVAVMVAGGAMLEDIAVARARRDLTALVDRVPRLAHRRLDTTIEDVAVDAIVPGDAVLVLGGEIIPVDGIVRAASAVIDESALTGEPIPVIRHRGEAARSGTLNAGDTFEITATATVGESAYAGIVRMVSAAQTAKAPFIRLADRFAILLLPVTLVVAGVAWVVSGDPIRGLAVLVAATPCPLILAAPVAFIAGVSVAARQGILIKGGGPLEALARVHTVMFDKTGTLTVGGARLIAIEAAPDGAPDEVLRLAASVEQASQHVVAAAIIAAAQARGLALEPPQAVRESAGAGLEARIGGSIVRVGSHTFVFGAHRPETWAIRVLRRASWRSALSIFVSVDGRAIGALLMGDELRRETPRAIRRLRKAGIARIAMVTGDRLDSAETIGAALDLDAVLADRVPSDKVDAVASEKLRHPTLMVGDGINDAPALAAADVGIAMGARGATASSEAADVVILVDRLDRVADAVVIARRARTIAMQSILAGLGLSAIAMAAAALGLLSPVAGALAQEAIDVAVILNALRVLLPPPRLGRPHMAVAAAVALRQEHEAIDPTLNRLREIADSLDDAAPDAAVALITEANALVTQRIVAHERTDEDTVYPSLAGFLRDSHGLGAMARAHREILHLARLLDRLATDLVPTDADRYLVRDAQRTIEAIESLVRLHNAQEEDFYEHAASG